MQKAAVKAAFSVRGAATMAAQSSDAGTGTGTTTGAYGP